MDRFLIAPLSKGMQNNVKPWLLPDDAYEMLTNAYLFRGRIRKRFGSRYMIPSTPAAAGYEQYPSRLGITLKINNDDATPVLTSGTGLATGNILNNLGATFPIALGQTFRIGTQVFTIVSNAVGPQAMLSNSTGAATFNFATGDYSIQTAPVLANAHVIFYPGLPVMGLPVYENTGTINNEPTIAFDTRFAYQFTANGWDRLNLETVAGDASWQGSNSQFFWATTYQGPTLDTNYLYVTNYNQNEARFMRYLDTNNRWNSFAPIIGYDFIAPAITLQVISARLIVSFRNHMVLMNVWEKAPAGNAVHYPNRIRYCAIGTPLDTIAGTPKTSYLPWIDDIDNPAFRGGGFIDNLQTQQEIVSAEFIKDRLIVYFERESWELVYTGNEQLPFVFQQINTEFGAQSTFSRVAFDTEVLAIAQNGITSCTGANVSRIDGAIPDNVFEIRQANEGVLRVQGIRDFKVEQVYWSIPSAATAQQYAQVYPNQVIVYNYVDRTWAYNYDCFTALGYWTQQPSVTWGSITTQWQYMTQTWSSGTLQSNFRQIVGGNQEGYVTIIDPDMTRNAGALQISNMTYVGGPLGLVELTIYSHNLTDTDIYTSDDEYICIENIKEQGAEFSWSQLNYDPVISAFIGIYPIDSIVDENTIRIQTFLQAAPANPYRGGGTVARVSNINILSKQWNPYVKQGQNVFIQKMNFLVSRTGGVNQTIPYGGSVTVDYYPSTTKLSMLSNSAPNALMSNGVLDTKPYPPEYYPLEAQQDRVWRSIYFAVDGNAIQIRISMKPGQIDIPESAFADFQLHAIELQTMPASYRIGG